MVSSRVLFVVLTVILNLVALNINAQQEILDQFCLTEQGNFSTNSAYEANLNHILSYLFSKPTIDYGFYTASYGQDPDIVRAMALCRGDVEPETCSSCISNSTVELSKHCPNQKEAILWYDYCMLRYSSRYFFGNMEFGPYFWMYNLNNVSHSKQYHKVLGTLLGRLKKRAASGGSHLKFAVGNTTTPSSQTIYALVQCTPDLSKQQCIDCLNNATGLIPKCCNGRQGGRVIAPSCNFRYEKDRFYDTSAFAQSHHSNPGRHHQQHHPGHRHHHRHHSRQHHNKN